MDLHGALRFLYTHLPAYAKEGRAAVRGGLRNITVLARHFGDPHLSYPTLHVAGTNGKGTVASALAAVLQQSGYRVGLYTSPHLKNFSERIRVNGRAIPDEAVVDFVRRVRGLAGTLNPSFFEMTVAMAFTYFSDASVDLAIIEAGLGGRLDSTNIVKPLLSVITSISHDHQEVLGHTLAEIAREKAGIIKEGAHVVLGDVSPALYPIFHHEAAKKKSLAIPIHGLRDRENSGRTLQTDGPRA